MKPPALTFDDNRLQVLESYGILDTPPEVGFDDIVYLASQICQTPVALVSLVAGDRQWFKARIGFEPCETDLNSSVCAHGLGSDELLIIPDLTQDERTRDNPLVTHDPHIRFYAGAPLISDTGSALGSLCVIDGKPRPEGLDERQKRMLQALARQVISQLELRRAVAEREKILTEKLSAEALDRANRALLNSLFESIDSGFCIIEMKFEDGQPVDYRFVEVNPAFERQTGLVDAKGRWMRDLAPDHEQHWFDRYGKVAQSGEPVRFENPANELDNRWFEVHAFPVDSIQGRRVGILFNDISERREIEATRRKAQATQNLLNQELSHRMKNTFAMVQAIASQTLRSVADQEPVEAFTSRVHALSQAHDVLLKQNWAAAQLHEVLNTVLGSVESIERFDISGPPVELGARATLSLSLLLHELTTNAMKYGGLSAPSGRVSIAWQIEGDGSDPELVLDWTERGGPPPNGAIGKGFGSRLIKMGLIGTGGGELDYISEGLRATFRAPLDQIQLS